MDELEDKPEISHINRCDLQDAATISDEKLEYHNKVFSAYREEIEKGDFRDLFFMITYCSYHGIPLPWWFGAALEYRLHLYMTAQVKEFGEAFEITRPKNWNMNAAKFHHANSVGVFFRILDLKDEGMKIGEAISQVASEFFISEKKTEALWLKMRNKGGSPLLPQQWSDNFGLDDED